MDVIRQRVVLHGVVQGVGFRPHVAQVAARHPITGFCGNDATSVFIETQGTRDAVEEFITDVLATLPPLAHVLDRTNTSLPVTEEEGFSITASISTSGERTLIPPDVATCDECLADMAEPGNRRYQYPFTTCTNCGPRLSIIEDLPYDRPNTTMRIFPMCPACETEYTTPTDRRFHAQPISCPNCGPQLSMSIAAARALIDAGRILAVKGIGGFHLMCDATNEDAVAELRRRKTRPDKPFAVMVPDLDWARRLVTLAPEEEELLTSPARPIVIASARVELPGIAPGLGDIGVLLPYTPLHSLLVDRPMVATSGNAAGEPLCFTNDDAVSKLDALADEFVLHDRDIHIPVEDSVFVGTMPSRRSRGYAPLPIPVTPGPTVLAVGGELKNTFALAHGDCVHVSAHVGDMGSLASQQAFDRGVEQMLRIQRAEPSLVVCDLHPGYATTALAERLAERFDVDVMPVQHHYAHALSLLTEHGIDEGPVVVGTFDGTGYGLDGTIWGGEILTIAEDYGWSRTWHVPSFPLVGGDRAVHHPWRIAAGISHAWDLDIPLPDSQEAALVASQLESGFGVVQSSSLGRLFDAASWLLTGITPTFEAHAAMHLEYVASRVDHARGTTSAATSFPVLFMELLSPGDISERALRFHHGVARLLAAQLRAAAEAAGTRTIGVTGGCALNRLLMRFLQDELADYHLLTHHHVPANDGGLSLGQAVAGRRYASNQ